MNTKYKSSIYTAFSRKIVSLLFVTVVGLTAASASAQTTSTLRCTPVLTAMGLPASNAPNATVTSYVTAMAPDVKERFEVSVCASLYGSYLVGKANNKRLDWLNGLPVVLANEIKGERNMALFERGGLGDAVPRRMAVTLTYVSLRSAEDLLWTLGHELGHGYYGHSRQQEFAHLGKNVAAAATGVGGAVLMFKKGGAVKKGLGAAMAVGGLAAATTDAPEKALAHRGEFQADEFGVRVLVALGYSLVDAQKVALDTLSRTPVEVMNESATHPSAKARLKAVAALK